MIGFGMSTNVRVTRKAAGAIMASCVAKYDCLLKRCSAERGTVGMLSVVRSTCTSTGLGRVLLPSIYGSTDRSREKGSGASVTGAVEGSFVGGVVFRVPRSDRIRM